MSKTARKSLLFYLISTILIFFFSLSLAEGKTSTGSQRGYCCINGQIISLSQLQCRQKKGQYFASRDDAKKNCKPADVFCCIDGKVKKESVEQCRKDGGKGYKTEADAKRKCKPAEVFCCIDGKVKKESAEQCRKNRGEGYKTEADAKRKCKPADVFCCVDGKVKKSAVEQCRKDGGKGYKTEADAKRKCRPAIVFCCINGKIKKSDVVKCRRDRGKAYKTETDAKRNCKPANVFCCVDGIVKKGPAEQCRRKRGKGYKNEGEAKRNCKSAEGYCCVNGKVKKESVEECKRHKGTFYTNALEARGKCQTDDGPSPNYNTTPTNKLGVSRPRADIRKRILPDLDIIRTSTNRKCFMKIHVQNIGGPINATDHAAAKMHLSAGPSQVSNKTNLIQIDPLGKLRVPGGSIIYTTNMRVTEPSQMSLSWIDTAHNILESDESNNGDDALLACKLSFVWCCVNGKVGKATKEECRKGGGDCPYE